MSNSLKDQLIKAGLVSKKQAHEGRRKKPKGRAANKVKTAEQKQRADEIAALDAHKRERDRELNAQRDAQRKAREQAEWVRQMLSSHGIKKQPPGEEDKAFHFSLDGAVAHLYVAAAQRAKLAAGQLGIVNFDGQYHLLPKAMAERVAERIPKRCWLPEVSDENPDEDDPYADYQVPDDLMW